MLVRLVEEVWYGWMFEGIKYWMKAEMKLGRYGGTKDVLDILLKMQVVSRYLYVCKLEQAPS